MKADKLKKYEVFKQLCFSDDAESLYFDFIKRKVIFEQEFESLKEGRVIHNTFEPSTTCRQCNKEVEEKDFDYLPSYWKPNKWFIVHVDCKKDAKKQEAYDCQCVDCSCNDCFFFERVNQNKGNCKKKKIEVVAESNFCCPNNLECFVHRLDGQE